MLLCVAEGRAPGVMGRCGVLQCVAVFCSVLQCVACCVMQRVERCMYVYICIYIRIHIYMYIYVYIYIYIYIYVYIYICIYIYICMYVYVDLSSVIFYRGLLQIYRALLHIFICIFIYAGRRIKFARRKSLLIL